MKKLWPLPCPEYPGPFHYPSQQSLAASPKPSCSGHLWEGHPGYERSMCQCIDSQATALLGSSANYSDEWV